MAPSFASTTEAIFCQEMSDIMPEACKSFPGNESFSGELPLLESPPPSVAKAITCWESSNILSMSYKEELEKRQTPACYDDSRKSKMANGPFVQQTAKQFAIDMLSSGSDKNIDYPILSRFIVD